MLKLNSKFVKTVCVMAAILVSADALAAKKYRIYGDKITGSRFRPIEVESEIPFNKGYGELTDAQKAAFRANYGVLKETEKPPYPVDGTEEIYDGLIEANKMIGMPGKLFLIANVDQNGSVTEVSVYSSPDPRITGIATKVLSEVTFEPAICDGTPCTMEFPFEFDLRTLEREEVDAMRRLRRAG